MTLPEAIFGDQPAYQGVAPDPEPREVLLDLRGVRKTYQSGSLQVDAVRGIDLQVLAGDYLAIMGPSGSGKSTLMHIIGCLDVPTAGSYRLAGVDVAGMGEQELAHVRNQRIGFVFQSFNLLPGLTVPSAEPGPAPP